MILVIFGLQTFVIDPFSLGDSPCFPFVSVIVLSVRRRRIIGQNTGIGPISLLFELIAQASELMVLTG